MSTTDSEKAMKECPKCKAMVSAYPPSFQRHLNKCGVAAAAPEAGASKPVEVKPRENLENIKSDDVRKIMEQALRTQEAMRKAPQAFVGDIKEDEHYILRKTYAPETLERYDARGRPLHTHSAYIGRADQIHVDVARGYVPVLNEQGEFVRNRGGDILHTIDRKISDGRIKAAGDESRSRLDRIADQVVARNPDLQGGDMKEESLGAVGTVTLTEDDRITTSGE